MKRTITALLVAAFLAAITPDNSRAGAGPALFMLVCAATAGALIIWVYVKSGEVKQRVIVLEKSHYDGNWVPVATNVMVIPPRLSLAFPAFSDRMEDQTACYRVREIPIPVHFAPSINPNSTAQPFIY